MPTYSTSQFRKGRVYACSSDFKTPDGQPYTWAPGQPSQWGDESFKIPLPTDPADTGLNADGTLLAVALQLNIYIYTVSGFTLLQVLKGHVSCANAVRFHPKEPRILVSCSMNNQGGSVAAESAIILETEVQRRILSLKKSGEEARNYGKSFIEVIRAPFSAGGRYVFTQTSSDRAIEVYDVVHTMKWRFAPPQRQTVEWG